MTILSNIISNIISFQNDILLIKRYFQNKFLLKHTSFHFNNTGNHEISHAHSTRGHENQTFNEDIKNLAFTKSLHPIFKHRDPTKFSF